jgi:hypothetical protein
MVTMDTIDLHDAEPPRSYSPYRVPAKPGSDGSLGPRPDTDPAMIFATVALLVASLIRLGPPFAGHEAFGVEPTLALGATLGCAWFALREGLFRLHDLRAARRAPRGNDGTIAAN